MAHNATVVIGGDVCPSGPDVAALVRGRSEDLFGDLEQQFRTADLSLINLECPLTDRAAPIAKCGPVLSAPTAAATGLSSAGIGLVNLANNHILDHGPSGLMSTLRTAKCASLATVGAGRNLDEARRIWTTVLGGLRIGIAAVAEHEFSIASATTPGANPLDLIDLARRLPRERRHLDYLIVLVHGGNEHYPYPSPRLRDACRFLAELGANAVVCQHSHRIGCIEYYSGCHIVYGQGNLLFHSPTSSPAWNQGLLVRLSITGPSQAAIELVPFERSQSGTGVRPMASDTARVCLQEFEERSKHLADDDFIRDEWEAFCRRSANAYLSMLLGHGRVLSRINRRHGWLSRLLYRRRALLAIRNLVTCEAHREVLETVLEHASGRASREPKTR